MTTVLTLAGAYGLPQLVNQYMGGTVTKGKQVVPVYYPNYVNLWPDFSGQSGTITWTKAMFDFVHKNVIAGVSILDGQIADAIQHDDVTVFTHSMGSWVATAWLRDKGPEGRFDPERLSFVLLGNSARKYGGLFQADVGGGVPQGNPFQVIDFALQYDGWADWPGDPQVITNVDAAVNAYQGMSSTHLQYQRGRLDDPNNAEYFDATTNVTYVWAMTYPVPILGPWATPSTDSDYRATIESAYSRPVVVPTPDYPALAGINPPGPGPRTPGWFVILANVNAAQRVLLHSSAGADTVGQSTDAATAFSLGNGAIVTAGVVAAEPIGVSGSAVVSTDVFAVQRVALGAASAAVSASASAVQIVRLHSSAIVDSEGEYIDAAQEIGLTNAASASADVAAGQQVSVDGSAAVETDASGNSSGVAVTSVSQVAPSQVAVSLLDIVSAAVVSGVSATAANVVTVRSDAAGAVDVTAVQQVPSLSNAAQASIDIGGPDFDAASGTSAASAGGVSWVHTATAGSDVFVIAGAYNVDESGLTVSYGGTPMTLVGAVDNGGFSRMAVWRLVNAPGGPQTVSAPGANRLSCWCAISVENVSAVAPATTLTGAGTSATNAVSVDAGHLAVQAFCGYANVTGSSGGTNLYTGNNNFSVLSGLAVSDADVATTFSATFASYVKWSALALVLS